MSTLRIDKINDNLPGVLTSNTLYLVKTTKGVIVYITDDTGSEAIPLNTSESVDVHPFLLLGVSNA